LLAKHTSPTAWFVFVWRHSELAQHNWENNAEVEMNGQTLELLNTSVRNSAGERLNHIKMTRGDHPFVGTELKCLIQSLAFCHRQVP